MAITAPIPAARGTATATGAALRSRETSLRLAGALLLALATAAFLFGAAWDIQWHPSVGRDRALTSPHLLLLSGIALSGLISLALILLDTWRAWRGREVDDSNSTMLLGVFRAPIGLYIAGSGALLGALAFPLDDYWHTLYGIDVTLWAPFHVMVISSMVMVGVGTLFAIASELNRLAAGRSWLIAQVGFAVVLALTLATLLLLLAQADYKEGLASIGGYQFVLYPILLAFALALALVGVVRVTRLGGAATIMALVFLAIRQGLYLFVPWAMKIAVTAEGFAYRPNAPTEVVTPYAYPTAVLAAALIVDAVARVARRRGLEGDRAVLVAGVVTSVLATFWDQPWAHTLRAFFYPSLDTGATLLRTLPFTVAAALVGAGAAVLLARSLNATRQ
ncbi:MAG TPA: hypothetical protein VKE41_08065 [Roseiflexaceae bacterium]|nr:hypothetical protein [Roseiflexaceae bacterium]